MNAATAARMTPLREPPPAPVDVAAALEAIVLNALVLAERCPPALAQYAIPRYLAEAMRWFYRQRPDPIGADAFEEWLVERWLREVRSEAFRESAQGQRLMAEWERGGR